MSKNYSIRYLDKEGRHLHMIVSGYQPLKIVRMLGLTWLREERKKEKLREEGAKRGVHKMEIVNESNGRVVLELLAEDLPKARKYLKRVVRNKRRRARKRRRERRENR